MATSTARSARGACPAPGAPAGPGTPCGGGRAGAGGGCCGSCCSAWARRAVVFFVGVAERIVYRERVMPGVSVEGVRIVGVSEKDAYVRLSALAAKLETAPLQARAGSRALVADSSIANVQVDEHATLAPRARPAAAAIPSRRPLHGDASLPVRTRPAAGELQRGGCRGHPGRLVAGHPRRADRRWVALRRRDGDRDRTASWARDPARTGARGSSSSTCAAAAARRSSCPSARWSPTSRARKCNGPRRRPRHPAE